MSIGLASKVSETDHRVETQELCVGDTCVTPKQFKTVFGIQSAVAVVRTVGAPRRRAAHPGQQEAWTPLPHRAQRVSRTTSTLPATTRHRCDEGWSGINSRDMRSQVTIAGLAVILLTLSWPRECTDAAERVWENQRPRQPRYARRCSRTDFGCLASLRDPVRYTCHEMLTNVPESAAPGLLAFISSPFWESRLRRRKLVVMWCQIPCPLFALSPQTGTSLLRLTAMRIALFVVAVC